MTSAYPMPDEELVDRVRALAAERGEWPSQRRVMRECRAGAPRANAALATLRAEGFNPAAAAPALSLVPDLSDRAETRPARTEAHAQEQTQTHAPGASDSTAPAADGLVTGATGAVHVGAPRVPRWPLLVIAAGAFVSIWSGWVGLGELTGFGPVVLLPGIADNWVINSAITLPLGVEAYAALAMWVWLSDAPVSLRARRFAQWSALGALVLGAGGQVAYHLMVAAGMERAPWFITAFVSCLPVVVLGCGAALVHLIHRQDAR